MKAKKFRQAFVYDEAENMIGIAIQFQNYENEWKTSLYFKFNEKMNARKTLINFASEIDKLVDLDYKFTYSIAAEENELF